jgi:spermidine synthase
MGLTLRQFQRERPGQGLRVAMLGMGIGTAAVYARDVDHYVYFEIDPAVVDFAERHFTFLSDSRGAREIRLGDARLQLEAEWRREGGQRYDVIVADTFSSDAVPMHLMTLECFQLYQQMLKPDGVLVVNISNAMLDLFPVLRGIATELGWSAVRMASPEDEERGTLLATWVALTENETYLRDPLIRRAEWPVTERDRPPLIWTDDFAALWQVVHW